MKRETINHTRRRIPRLCFSISMQMACKRSINRDCAVLITTAIHTPGMHDENRNRFIGRNQSDTVQKGKYLLPFRFDSPRFAIHRCRPLLRR